MCFSQNCQDTHWAYSAILDSLINSPSSLIIKERLLKLMNKLSPSDFAYLYEECKLCYWLKVKKGISQPSMPMPGVFGAINTRIQGTLLGKSLESLSKDLPKGVVE